MLAVRATSASVSATTRAIGSVWSCMPRTLRGAEHARQRSRARAAKIGRPAGWLSLRALLRDRHEVLDPACLGRSAFALELLLPLGVGHALPLFRDLLEVRRR